MRNEDYVSYELAKKLKEKGFEEKVSAIYICENHIKNIWRIKDGYVFANYNANSCIRHISAPTLWQIQKFFRKKKGIHINVEAGANGDKVFYDFTLYKEVSLDGLVGLAKIGINKNSYSTYEDALSAGIETAIDFIKNI